MSRSFHTMLLIVLSSFSCYSQKFEWARAFNGDDFTYGKSVVVDDDGNVIISGEFNKTVDFDPGPGVFNMQAKSDFDIYITKLDKNGNFLWAKSLGGETYPTGIMSYAGIFKNIAVDSDGNVYICGGFDKTRDFDPGPGIYNLSSSGGFDIFVVKLDPFGNLVWGRSFGGALADIGKSIVLEKSNIFITGYYNSSTSFILKLDTAGNSIFFKTLSGGSSEGNSICTDKDGNIFIAGWFDSIVDFDPGAGVFNLQWGVSDIYILKLDSNGNFLWVKGLVGNAHDCYSISTDQQGNVYATGCFDGSTDFDPGAGVYYLQSTLSSGAYSAFILKLDSNGNFMWAKSFYDTSNADINLSVIGFSLSIDKYGYVYTTGFFRGEVDFDPGPGIYKIKFPPAYFDAVYLSKLDADGNFVWALAIGSNNNSIGDGLSIFLDKSTNIYVSGVFSRPLDFDPGPGTYSLISTGLSNAFILKLSQCQPTDKTDSIKACHSYTWLDGKTYTESTDTAKFIIENKAGCDSIISLDLIILKPDSTTIYHEACKNYEWKDHTYEQSGVYQYDTMNAQGCDSTVFLNLTIIKPDTIHQAKAACDSYIWHNKMYDQSGTYFFDTLSTRSCDSTVVLKLTINHSAITQLSQTSCDSLAWHGKTYHDTGIYQYKTQTIAGCDSTIILNLKINKSDKTALSQSSCDSYTWNGNTYMQSGTYTYQTINSEGCDSIVSLQLIITDHIERSDTINICEGDSISLFGNWISEEGEISGTFISSAGCDSIQTYKILIDALPVSDIAANICEGDSIFLYRQWFSQAGNYAIRKPNNAACDSLININITLLPVKNSRDTISICKGDTLNPEGIIIVSDTEIQRVLSSAQSCDSIVHLHIAMLEPALTQRTIKLCPGDSILIAGNWIKVDALIEEHFTASNSCDSTSMSEIVLLAEPEAPQYEIDCETREVKLMIEASSDWQILWDNGSGNSETTYKDTKEARVVLSSIPGCSRSFTMSLPQIPDLSLIKLPSDTSVARNIMVNLSLDLDTSEWQLQWYPAGVVDCPTCSSVIITATESTDMILQLTHESGCRYEVNFRIELEEGEIYVPNIFTPDGDGKNDLWKVKIPSDLYMLSCQIFDRWGEMVYRANAVEPIGWDGTFRGKKTQTGVYVYVIEYRNADGESRTIKGDVTVVR